MAYVDLIEKENIDQQFLVIIEPRRIVEDFTLVSGSIYKTTFDYGEVVDVMEADSALSQASSSGLSAGEFYYDTGTEEFYVRTTGSVNPSGVFLTATYEMHFATKDLHFTRDPLDASTREIYYQGLVQKSPILKRTASDNIFGLMPVLSSSISLINADHIFEKHIYDSSFNKARISVYHALKDSPVDEIVLANIDLVYEGLCSDVSYADSTIQIKTFDGIDELNVDYRNDDASFFSTTDFPTLNPQSIGKPIRYVYGVVDGFVPVNVDYVESSLATDSDNRVHVVMGEQVNLSNLTKLVGGGVHTTTRTFLTSVSGLRTGDQVYMNRASGTDDYKIITDVGANYIDHSILADGAMTNGDSVERSYIGKIEIIQNGILYEPLFTRDWVTSPALSVGTSGFTFANNFEANHVGMEILTPNDQIFLRVYGRTNDVTLGGSYGSNDSSTANITHPGVIIVDLFKRVVGIPESRIDIPSFTSFLSARTDAYGLAMPHNSGDAFPTVKALVQEMFQSSLFSLFINDDQKWEIKALGPLGAITKSVDDDEILRGSFDYFFDYQDILSQIIVQYKRRELSGLEQSGASTLQVTAESLNAIYLHKVVKQKTFSSLHFKEADAQELADRLSFIFGDRIGTATIKVKNRFFDTELLDNIEISRTKLPGFAYDIDTNRSREFAVEKTQKGLNAVSLDLTDLKGISDNEADW